MCAALTTIRNIGPAVEKALASAGIRTVERLRDLGADAAYAAMIQAGTRPHFIGYYSLVMGLQGRPWNDCAGTEKEELRARFDALVADNAHPERSQLARALDEVGILIDGSGPKPS